MKYRLDKNNYNVVHATVEDAYEYDVGLTMGGGHGPIKILKYNRARIVYENNGKEYDAWTELFPEYQLGDHFDVAINNKKPDKPVRVSPFSIEVKPTGYYLAWFYCILLDVLLMIGIIYNINLIKKEDAGSSEYDVNKPTEIEQQKLNEIKRIEYQEKRIKQYIIDQHLVPDFEQAEFVKDNFALNDACGWYVFQGCNIADICLVQEVDGQSVCVNETNKAWENGLPKEYYVIAIKDNYYLCCCTKDEFVYSFSSGHFCRY